MSREREGGVRHSALRHPDHGGRRDGGAPAGRAPVRPDRLGRRGPHDVRARPHHLGRRPRAGTTELNGVPVHRHPSAHGRLPDFYGLDGTAPPRPPAGHAGTGKAVGRLQRPRLPPAGRRRGRLGRRRRRLLPRTSTTRRWRPSARCACRPCFHPAAHDEPALYLPVFRGTFGDADAFCFYTASERTLVERMYQVAERPQIVLGLGVGDSEAAGRPGGELAWSRATVPTWSASGGSTSTRAPRCWRRTSPPTRSGIPARSPSPSSGRSRWSSTPHPDIVVTGAVERGRQMGHRARRAGGGLAVGARVVLPRGDRGLGRAACRSWSTAPAGRPGSTASVRAAGCGSPRTPSSRRCSTGWCPTPSCGPSWGGGGGPSSTATSAGRCWSSATTSSSTTVVERGRGTPGLF